MSDTWAQATIGDVVLLAAPESDEYVPAILISVSEDGPTVAPISERVELAAEWDLFLGKELLGYDALAEIWNYGTVLPEQLAARVVTCPPALIGAITATVHAALAGAAVPTGVVAGPPILDDADARLLFQDAESDRLRTFWEPTLVLAGAMTLGQLVRHRREDLDVAAQELEDVGPRAGWIPELERDVLDIAATLRPQALAGLMRRLRIGASQRLGRITATTLESGTPALARKGQAPASEDVNEYVTAFLEELRRDDR